MVTLDLVHNNANSIAGLAFKPAIASATRREFCTIVLHFFIGAGNKTRVFHCSITAGKDFTMEYPIKDSLY